ncbi:MAG TPA: primosomal protein N', partial [Phycisphaerae bacterium]|nr:primosomal protein N' [Phycisphaerae bacterium]
GAPITTQTARNALKSPTMTPDSLFATVAIDQPVDATYTYLVPTPMHRDIRPGSRVTVPLGRANRPTPATILSLSTTAPELPPIENRKSKTENTVESTLFAAPEELKTQDSALKTILDLHRDVLPVPPDLLQLAQWISTYYCAPIGSTLATMVPAAVKKATRLPANLTIHLTDPTTPPEQQFENKKISPKTKKVFQQLHFFLAEGPKPEHEVLTHAQIARPMLKRLLSLNLLRMERNLQLPDAHILGATPDSIENRKSKIENLTPDQQTALTDITTALDQNKFAVRLLHGVTGSGKTEVYIRAIQQVVDAGKRAIVLVPEISLTPQTVRRFTARFPRVAVLHSGMKDSERHQHWHAIASGWAQVIVGARSAIFAPASDIGLIVVDEEHDPSYKQDNLPKYHGRDVAIRRAQMLNIPILLGSATPALESWQNAQPAAVGGGGGHKDWKLLSLTSRPLGTAMPRVLTVDMKSQSKERRGLHILSTTLEHHLRQTLEQKKQSIFLLNRRGYAHYVMCPRCDWVLMCDNCDATMVVHRKRPDVDTFENRNSKIENRGLRGKVQCHYCLTAMMLPDSCPLCQARLTHLGQGTQRAEDELLRKFPNIRLQRMDSDSMNNARDYQETLDAFGRGDLDLLIGTQMISKGLDFPNVQLVGVLNSDLAMTIPDFRAAERTFQLICQVAGRAGRTMNDPVQIENRKSKIENFSGTVIVQTFQPHEPAILHACNHDYLGFVQSELPHRKEFGYPPFGRIVRLVLAHKSYTKVHAAAADMHRLATAITQKMNLPIRIQGPFPPPMERLVELYRVELIFFAATPRPLQTLLANLRARGLLHAGHTRGTPGISNVAINVDVDPLHMM